MMFWQYVNVRTSRLRAEVHTEWIHTSTPLSAFMAHAELPIFQVHSLTG